MGKKHSIPLHGTCTASLTKVLSSNLIQFPFMTKKIRVAFALGCQRLMQIKVFVSIDARNPVSGEPDGVSILGLLSSYDYVVGDDNVVELEDEQIFDGGRYIKVYANNSDPVNHTIDCIVTIEELET